MKRILSCIALALILSACSQNNGHIGPIHGAWTLVEMSADGVEVPDDGQNTICSFQGEIIQITHILVSPDIYTKNFGNFKLEDKSLTLRFEAGLSGPEGYQYTAPQWMGFPADGAPIAIRVESLGAEQMTWEWTSPEGVIFTYKFKKTW